MYILNGNTSQSIAGDWIALGAKQPIGIGFQVSLSAVATPIGLFVFEITNDIDPAVVTVGPCALTLPSSFTALQPTDGLARSSLFDFSPAPSAKFIRMRYARTSGGGANGLSVAVYQRGQ
jgi:hypothetical protein